LGYGTKRFKFFRILFSFAPEMIPGLLYVARRQLPIKRKEFRKEGWQVKVPWVCFLNKCRENTNVIEKI